MNDLNGLSSCSKAKKKYQKKKVIFFCLNMEKITRAWRSRDIPKFSKNHHNPLSQLPVSILTNGSNSIFFLFSIYVFLIVLSSSVSSITQKKLLTIIHHERKANWGKIKDFFFWNMEKQCAWSWVILDVPWMIAKPWWQQIEMGHWRQ